MDTFFEQIVSIKKSGKALIIGISVWIFALFIIAFLLLFASSLVGGFAPFLVIGVGYGAWWLTSKLNIEYEYIVTNGEMDIDKIINKSARQRVSSFKIANVERIEKYNPNLLTNVNRQNVVFACNQGDPNAYLLVASREDTKVNYIVFAPNEKVREGIKKSLPKFIANSAFK
jgi:ABC-type transport system involved in multi-copper enzyme maturation permease subunit